ncbi:MAG: Biopolymer transport protein ExbB [Opitutia bacterium UBA7350]|nr:MAG: Biopolymer transport protein ExbB [Opitutae bacterium UBA7350]
MDLLINAGVFLYPLALCSLVAVAITIERLLALRSSRVMPNCMVEALLSHDTSQLQGDSRTVIGRIIAFRGERAADVEALNAFARVEVSRMERGIFLLEVIIGVAPLLGLLGTVTGLTQVFSGFSAETGLPEPAAFIRGIALALNTTILGLAIAIPALVAHAYLLRKVESLAARIGMGVQALTEDQSDQ